MIVGLGTGTTAYHTIVRVGELVAEGLNVQAVCTSSRTMDLANSLNIPCIPLDEVTHIDLTIDGADEIDPQGNGIKGGRGALLYEKIVASYSRQNIWVVGEQKLVKQLGAFPLPVEVVPFGHKLLMKKLVDMGFHPVLRMEGTDAYLTDSRNYILDLHLEKIEDPEYLHDLLKTFPGVVEHGLFLETVNIAVAATETNTRIINFR